MEFYEQTRLALEVAGLTVHRHPLVWFKSDNSGIVPGRDNQYTRRVYETAFLCSRGRRPLVKTLANLYSAPNPSNPIHPTQKSEPMLRHFFSMLVDENTDVFDPTCGSGSALRAAESLGARRTLGLELNPDYAKRANQTTISARGMRKAAQ
jgi:DNA modification methylase